MKRIEGNTCSLHCFVGCIAGGQLIRCVVVPHCESASLPQFGSDRHTHCLSDVFVVSTLQVEVSKIFDWYYPDFGDSKAARLRFLLPYLQAEQRSRLDQLLAADPNAAGIKVTFKPYDWTINAAAEE